MRAGLRLPTPAMGVACVALCLAVGGGGYIAVADGGGNAVKAAKKKKGKRGPRGRQGPPGPAGQQGPPGPAGATNVVVRTRSLDVSGGGNNGTDVFCQPGERALSGGAHFTLGSTNEDRLSPVAPLTGTSPLDAAFAVNGQTPTGFSLGIHNGDAAQRPANFWVVCASP